MEDRLLVLHGLAVRKAGSAQDVARVTDLDEHTVVKHLEDATEEGTVLGKGDMFMPTPQGRAVLTDAYPEVFADLREDGDLAAAYGRFEHVDRELKEIFTNWQTKEVGGERVANEHQDQEYDNTVIDRLGRTLEHADIVLDELVEVVPRLAAYRERLDDAYDRVLAGEHEYVSAAKKDSVHTIWFELHEDLLRMLGRERDE